MICKGCGTQNDDSAKFCKCCGSKLIVESKHEIKKNNFTKIIIFLIVIIVIAIIGVCGYWLISIGIIDFGEILNDKDSIAVEYDYNDGQAITEATELLTEEPTAAPTEESASTPQISADVQYETIEVESATHFEKATASSVLSDELQYNYKASNVLNYDTSCWCEGSSGYGIGEWIKLELPYTQKVSGLRIINGYAGTETQYNHNSKISRVLIEFSNGQSVSVDLEVFDVSYRNTIQYVDFSQPVETSYVKITIEEVSEGECMDTCLTYVAPY